MRLLYFTVIITLILVACSSKDQSKSEKEAQKTEALTKPRAKVLKKTKKPDFYSESKNRYELSDNQINRLKNADKIRKSNLKGQDKKGRQEVNRMYSESVKNELKDPNLVKRFNRFKRDWENPLSYYNLKRELSLTRPQIRNINSIKKDSRVAIRAITTKDKAERKAEVAKINRVEMDKIILLLTDEQKSKFEGIRKSIPKKRLQRFVIFQ